jgi:hypothetical protein
MVNHSHHNHSQLLTEIVTITVNDTWIDVCHHAKFYLGEFCSFLMQDPREVCQATPLKVGSQLCFRGICICLHPTRRQSQDYTELIARLHHRVLITNDTVWPDWIASVRVEPDVEETPYYLIVSTGFVLLTALLLMCCMVRMIKRYVGYHKVAPPEDDVTEKTRLTD